MHSVKLKLINPVNSIYSFSEQTIRYGGIHKIKGMVFSKNIDIRVKCCMNNKFTIHTFKINLKPSDKPNVKCTFKERKYKHIVEGFVTTDDYLYYNIKCNNSNKIVNFEFNTIFSSTLNYYHVISNSHKLYADVTGKELKFIDLGLPHGSGTFIKENDYNTYNHQILVQRDALEIMTSEFSKKPIENGHIYKYNPELKENGEPIILLDETECYNMAHKRRDVNSCTIVIGFILYIYSDKIRVKLIFYDILKAFDVSNKKYFITFDDKDILNCYEYNENEKTLKLDGSDKKLQTTLKQILTTDIKENMDGLEYVYINKPFGATVIIEDGQSLGSYLYNYGFQLKIDEINILSCNIFTDIKFEILKQDDSVELLTIKDYVENIIKKNYKPTNGEEIHNKTMPCFITSIVPAILEYTSKYLYHESTEDVPDHKNNTPNHNDYIAPYFMTSTSSLYDNSEINTYTNNKSYQKTFLYQHLNDKRFSTYCYYFLTPYDLIKNTFKKDYDFTENKFKEAYKFEDEHQKIDVDFIIDGVNRNRMKLLLRRLEKKLEEQQKDPNNDS